MPIAAPCPSCDSNRALLPRNIAVTKIADDLLTVRDLLRYAVSCYNAADVGIGHGTSEAIDDAVFLILETLNLPIDDINPWLDARLSRDERKVIVERIDRRVTEKVPTPYLVGKAYIQGVPFVVDPRVIIPRSFIGELLFSEAFSGDDDSSLIRDPAEVLSVADICTGSGCLAILAAMVFPNAVVDAVDLSEDALDVAAINVDNLGDSRVSLYHGDLFAPLEGQRYDLIISNPPYVDDEAMAELPEEYRHEPEMALAGGLDGLDLVRRIIEAAPDHLNPGGGLICEIGSDREILEMTYPDLPFVWLDTAESEGEVFWLSAADLGVIDDA